MSTVISLKEISQLHKNYQALHQGASEPERLVRTLPDHFREKTSLSHKDNLSKSVTYLKQQGFPDSEIMRVTGHSTSEMVHACDKSSRAENASKKVNLIS